MKEAFVTHVFRPESLERIAIANEIIEDYANQGIFELSLRQVYYRFVARNVIVNDYKSYKVLGRLISKARMAGLIDWSAIRDRGRILNTLPHWETTGEIVNSAAGQYRVDLWQDQPTRVEVWTEKDAAIAVIDDLCRRYDVPYLACRGDSSTTAEYEAAMRFRRYRALGQRCVVLYGGDHDAAGVPMSDDHDRRLNEDFQVRAEIERVALNLDQVRQYGLPPNPVKESEFDRKAKPYIEQFGHECWEIEALDPVVLQDLIEQGILRHLDLGLFEARQKLVTDGRRALRKQAQNQLLIEELMKVGQPTLDKAARNVPAVERFLRTLP